MAGAVCVYALSPLSSVVFLNRRCNANLALAGPTAFVCVWFRVHLADFPCFFLSLSLSPKIHTQRDTRWGIMVDLKNTQESGNYQNKLFSFLVGGVEQSLFCVSYFEMGNSAAVVWQPLAATVCRQVIEQSNKRRKKDSHYFDYFLLIHCASHSSSRSSSFLDLW